MNLQESIRRILREELEHTTFESFFSKYGEGVLDIMYNDLGEEVTIKELEKYYNDEIKYLNKIINQKLPIFRLIKVNDNVLESFIKSKKIKSGIFWTLNKQVTKYWAPSDLYDDRFELGGDNTIIFESELSNELNIDTEGTIFARFTSLYEDEIRLLVNTPINIKNVFVNGKKINIENKIFIS